MVFADRDFECLVTAHINNNGTRSHIHEPMSRLPDAIKQIITTQFEVQTPTFEPYNTSKDASKNNIKVMQIRGKFTNVEMKPSTRQGSYGVQVVLDPTYCRANNLTYCADVYISGVITVHVVYNNDTEADFQHPFDNMFAFSIPIEIGNKFCVYSKSTPSQIYMAGGDMSIQDGFFIITGQLYAVLADERLCFNIPQNYYDIHKSQVGRTVLLSREWIYRNSYQLIMVLHKTDLITLELTFDHYRDKPFPFTVMFNLLGFMQDNVIEDMILQGSDRSTAINRLLQQRIQHSVTQAQAMPQYAAAMRLASPEEVAKWVVNYTRNGAFDAARSEDEQQHLLRDVWNMVDNKFLIHQSPASDEYSVESFNSYDKHTLRHKKAQILAKMIRDQIVTVEQKTAGTDRDHPAGKRYYTAAHQLTQATKRNFNTGIVMVLREALMTAFKTTEMSRVSVQSIVSNVFRQAKILPIFESEFKNANSPYITVRTRQVTPVICSEGVSPLKSPTHAETLMAQIQRHAIQSKESERAYQIRSIHPGSCGFLDPVTTPDTGERVGMPTCLTVMSSITGISPIDIVRREILQYKDFMHYSVVDATLMGRYPMVYINGDWYGCIADGNRFVAHFRALRRRRVLDPLISIVFNIMSSRIDFWTDEGRLYTPFVVVYSNAEELDKYDDETAKMDREKWPERLKARPQFNQYVKFTAEVRGALISGAMSYADLFDQGILEYITAEESINCIAAQNYKTLWQNRHDECHQYTHLFIPLNMFCLTSLLAMLPNMSDSTRHCFFTNQAKQTNAAFSPNISMLSQKNTNVQAQNFYPLNPTPGMNFVNHGGYVGTIAFKADGNNQDDSINFNEGYMQRCGFLTCNFNHVSSECNGPDEIFGYSTNPALHSMSGNRRKLNGRHVVPVGTIIEPDDVIISKYIKKTLPNGQIFEMDASVSYNNHETAYVHSVKELATTDGKKITVYYQTIRRPTKGTKFASFCGNKGVISRVIPESMLPYDVISGRRPDIIINTHSIPSRMLPGELISDMLGEFAATHGITLPVSPFVELDLKSLIDHIRDQAKDGLKPGMMGDFAEYPMRDPRSGELSRALFMTMSIRQGLQKFAAAEASSRTMGRINSATRQSLPGAANNGGLRTGEMEYWIMTQNGAAATLDEFQRSQHTVFQLPICQNCGNMFIYNPQKDIALCRICRDAIDPVLIDTKFVTGTIVHYVEGMGIEMNISPERPLY